MMDRDELFSVKTERQFWQIRIVPDEMFPQVYSWEVILDNKTVCYGRAKSIKNAVTQATEYIRYSCKGA